MNPADLTLVEHLARHARTRPHKPFVVLADGPDAFRMLTYGDLQAQSRQWAQRMATAPQEPGRRVVAIVLPHGLDIYPATMGALRAGLHPTILAPPSPKQDAALHWEAHRALFARIRPALVVTGPEPVPELAALAAEYGAALVTARSAADGETPPDALSAPARTALLQHSSGTTGLKKGVVLTHAQIGLHVDTVARRLKLSGDDVVASWLPLYHDMGLITGFLMPLILGASVVTLDPFSWVGDPCSILRLIERHRATVSWTPNFGLAHLVRTRDPAERFDLTSLRTLVNCSEPCRPETVRDFVRVFGDCGVTADTLSCCYGMAEVVFAATQTQPGAPPRVLRLDRQRLDEDGVVAPVGDGPATARSFLSCGEPLPGVRLRIEGAENGEARAGEILVRSRTLFAGYHLAPELDAEAMTADGWHRSGDIGFLHDGELYVCGRRKEMLIVNGRNFYAGDIESLASAVPGVRPGRVAALGVPDAETGGEACVLLLETEAAELDAAAQAELGRAVRARVEAALDLHVRRLEFGPPGWVVKSTSGKMSRAENLRRLQARDAERAAADPPEPAPVMIAGDSAPPPRAAEPWWRRRLAAALGPRRPLEPLAAPVSLAITDAHGEATAPEGDYGPPAPEPPQAPPPLASDAPEAPDALEVVCADPAPGEASDAFRTASAPEAAAPDAPTAVEAHPPPAASSAREAVALAVEQCFGVPAAAVHDAMGPGDVGGWDSLGHTILMLRLERISRREVDERVAAARTVGAIAAALEGRGLAEDDRRAA